MPLVLPCPDTSCSPAPPCPAAHQLSDRLLDSSIAAPPTRNRQLGISLVLGGGGAQGRVRQRARQRARRSAGKPAAAPGFEEALPPAARERPPGPEPAPPPATQKRTG
jgi:hypothetical protein